MNTFILGGVHMVMGWIWTSMILISIVASLFTGTGKAMAGAAMAGAQQGVTLALSMAGAICLWTGIGKLMGKVGITDALSRLLRPALNRIFPTTRTDPVLAQDLSGNICANFLGLGNAATPMGIAAAKRLKAPDSGTATHEMCRLIVLNTASIQLLPTNVAAVRSALGCATPFDILPAVWLTSICSAGLGVTAAWILGKVWKQ